MMSPRVPLSLVFVSNTGRILAAAALCVALVSSQDPHRPERQEVPLTAPVEPEEPAPYPIVEREILESSFQWPGGDDPDYAPMQEVINHEGMTVGTRLSGNPYRLAFVGGEFEPVPGLDPLLAAWLAAHPGEDVHAFVMLRGRLADPEKIRALEQAGAVLLGPHTWQSFRARIPAHAVPALAALPFVHWVGFARAWQKLDPVLARAMDGAEPGQLFEVYANLFESALGPESQTLLEGELREQDEMALAAPTQRTIPGGPWQRKLEEAGLRITFYCPWIHAFRGLASVEQIHRIRELAFVQFVEPVPVHSAGHDQSMAMIGQDRVRTAYPGTDVSVGIIDTGLNSSPWHNDLSGKVYVGWATTTAGVWDDQHGHGTHVAGTVLGRGVAQARYRGAAPEVARGGEGDRTFIGRYLNNSGSSEGDVSTLYTAFASDFVNNSITNPRPRFICNSWGARGASGYSGTEAGARQVDAVVYNNNQCYVFITHNTGGVSGTWCASPGSAKNVLTVGGVQDTWSSTTQPGSPYTGTRWATTDNRFKPEIVAVAHQVTSCNINTATGYRNSSGTSMAAPHVVGILASLRDRSSFYDLAPAPTKALAAAAAKFDGTPTRDASQQLGYGTVNSYKMNYASSGHTFSTNKGSLSSTGSFQTADIAIPANVTAVKVVLSWIEPAASSGASAARTQDVRCYFDIDPFQAGGNTGEFSASSGNDNTVYYRSYAGPTGNFATQAAGKTVRFKVYAQSVTSRIDWGLTVFLYFRSSTGAPSLSSTVSTALVAPSATLTMTPRLQSTSANDDFDAARLYPVLPSGWSVTRLERTLVDGILQAYTDTSHTSSPFPALVDGIALGQGIDRAATFTLRAPATGGLYQLRFETTQFPGALLFTTQSVCVDGTPPNTVANLRSTSHTTAVWSNVSNLAMAWNTPTDVGCAGIQGLAYSVTSGSAGTPTTMNITGAATTRTVALGSSSSGRYFNIRAVDNRDLLSTSTSSSGPYYIDLTAPSTPAVTIAGGAAYTSTSSVSVTASSSDTYSGPHQMRYSSDNSTWSGWYSYTTSARTIDLSANGGNTNEGVKTLYVQVRDQAGNVSPSGSDTIEYLRLPVFSAATTATLENVTDGYYRFTGTDFVGITTVKFGTATLTSTLADDWYQGYFRVLSDTVLYVYPPQGLVAGNYAVTPVNPAATGTGLSVAVTYPTARRLRCPSQIKGGKVLNVLCHRGTMPAGTLSLLTLSADPNPSVFPGLISLSHGGLFGPSFMVWPTLITHNGTTGAARWTMNVPVGVPSVRVYFQAAMLDPGNPNLVPFRVSERDDIQLY